MRRVRINRKSTHGSIQRRITSPRFYIIILFTMIYKRVENKKRSSLILPWAWNGDGGDDIVKRQMCVLRAERFSGARFFVVFTRYIKSSPASTKAQPHRHTLPQPPPPPPPPLLIILYSVLCVETLLYYILCSCRYLTRLYILHLYTSIYHVCIIFVFVYVYR